MQLKYNGGDVLSNIYTHREPTGSFLLISHGSGVVPKGVLSIYMYVPYLVDWLLYWIF
jgi:hypothetical protein